MSAGICGKCLLPIHPAESGIRYFGTFTAHSEARCLELLRLNLSEIAAERDVLKLALNTPEIRTFSDGVVSEAQHQRVRWGSDHDAGKNPEDWFWLIGYLGGKALRAQIAGDIDKALHHTISTAAALANWHAAILGQTNMRPGIDPVAHGIESAPGEVCL